MHGDQEPLTDELVEFEVVHMAALADLRSVDDHEQVVVVDVHPRDVVSLATSRMAIGWKPNSSASTCSTSSLHSGMSSQKKPFSRAAARAGPRGHSG